MKLNEVLNTVLETIPEDALIISIFGQISEKLYEIRDLDSIFYMRGGMGLASSVGLGVSLSVPERRVVILDGDGSATMNMNTFATISNAHPKNLVHIIVDNQVHGSIGGYPSFTSNGLDFSAVAKACGINSASKTSEVKGLRKCLAIAFSEEGPHVIVATVEFEKSAGVGHAVRLVHIKERFMKAVREDNPNLADL
ncbi:MAG: thiamine pyrophosphate-dependent enzyme [Thermoplasmatales archaeon]|nr:thiamine pyrophosphate-dependent enzyme [Thermoplasmatales archaeon]